MISITTLTPRINDSVLIREYSSELKRASARISKIKTLDGGVFVAHSGFADGDRNINVSANLSKAETDILWDIFTTQTFVTVSTSGGVFNAVIKSVNITPDKTRLLIEFESKIS